jgi:hypothetical protein
MSVLDSDPNTTFLQLAYLVERVGTSFSKKRITGTVFRDFAKALDTVWVSGVSTI